MTARRRPSAMAPRPPRPTPEQDVIRMRAAAVRLGMDWPSELIVDHPARMREGSELEVVRVSYHFSPAIIACVIMERWAFESMMSEIEGPMGPHVMAEFRARFGLPAMKRPEAEA